MHNRNMLTYRRDEQQPIEKYQPGELLGMYRRRAGLTQAQLAKSLGFKSERMLQLWEGGYTLPTAERLQALIKFYVNLKIVFKPGSEETEARQLWTAVKAMFDANSERRYETYAVFDRSWFEGVLDRPTEVSERDKITPINIRTMETTTAPTATHAPGSMAGDNGLALPVLRRWHSLIGRQTELNKVCEWLRGETRLVTLVGIGGTGKTRLAEAAMAELNPVFADGVWFVKLAAISDPVLVASTIAQTLGIEEGNTGDALHALKSYLKIKSLLLVLDNFEQLLEAKDQIAQLLEVAPQLKIIVTSRTNLELLDEQELVVRPLTLPTASSLDLTYLHTNPAVTLLVERAAQTCPGFCLDEQNASALVEICIRLDGLPLALELAAPRLKLFTPQALLERLKGAYGSSPLGLLTGGKADLPQHQRTLRQTLEWSYQLLAKAEQTLLQYLAVFRSGCTLAAIEFVCQDLQFGEADSAMLLDLLIQLENHNLVWHIQSVDGEPRFVLLEVIREFALEKLAQVGSQKSYLEGQHATFYMALAEEGDLRLANRQQLMWLEQVAQEHDNLRATLEWTLNSRDNSAMALRVAGAIAEFWAKRGHLSEGRRWIGLALAKSATTTTESTPQYLSIKAKALLGSARLAHLQTDFVSATIFNQESLQIGQHLQDKTIMAHALLGLGATAHDRSEFEEATHYLNQSLALYREIGDAIGVALVLDDLTRNALYQMELEQARAFANESLQMRRNGQGGDEFSAAFPLYNLAIVAMFQYDLEAARRYAKESLVIAQITNYRYGIIYCLELLAGVAVFKEQPLRVARLCGVSETLREIISAPMAVGYSKMFDNLLVMARAKTDPATFKQEWQNGRKTSVEQAMIYALQD